MSSPLIVTVTILAVSCTPSAFAISNQQRNQALPEKRNQQRNLRPPSEPVNKPMMKNLRASSEGMNKSFDLPKGSKPPKGKRFAIIFRGQSFRGVIPDGSHFGDRRHCQTFVMNFQLNDTASVLENIVEPLEIAGNEVHVYVTDNPCALTPKISEVFGKRTVATEYFAVEDQREGFMAALNLLNSKCGGSENVQNYYDYVMVFRHDMLWKLPLPNWEVDWRNFNFFTRCEERAGANVGGEDCVWDTVHIVPSKYYKAFNDVIGDRWFVEAKGRFWPCFAVRSFHGHACYWPIYQAMMSVDETAEIGFVFNAHFAIREGNNLLELELPEMPPQGLIADERHGTLKIRADFIMEDERAHFVMPSVYMSRH